MNKGQRHSGGPRPANGHATVPQSSDRGPLSDVRKTLTSKLLNLRPGERYIASTKCQKDAK